MCFTNCAYKVFNYINSFLTVLCCSSVSNVCLLSLLHSFGCVGVRLFCYFVGVGVVTSGLRSELLGGVVWYDFPFISIVVF